MFTEQCKMDNSPGDARGEVAEKEERYGLVHWHSLKVVPLSCIKEKTKIVLDHLPVRCKSKWSTVLSLWNCQVSDGQGRRTLALAAQLHMVHARNLFTHAVPFLFTHL